MSHEYIELELYRNSSAAPGQESSSPPKYVHAFSERELEIVLPRLGYSVEAQYNLPTLVWYMLEKIDQLSEEAALRILRDALVEHASDTNFPSSDYALIELLIKQIPTEGSEASEETGGKSDARTDEKDSSRFFEWSLLVRTEAALIRFHSPYPEVRAVVDPFDDPTIPAETLRVYVIALLWTMVGAVVNNFFVHRLPGISLPVSTVQLLLLPSGRLWERYVPKITIRMFGRPVILNPGPWNHKEMMLSSIIYSCSAGTPYAIYNIVVMKLDKFYGLEWVSATYQVLLTLSTQFLGFSFAFLMLKVCVRPKKAVWPTLLPALALNRALMNEDTSVPANGWKISRYGFFFLVCTASFFYNWIPTYLFTAISTFNWPTWFAPNLIHLTNVSGSHKGLGLNPVPSLDWNVLGMAGCLTLPFYTYLNNYIGTVCGFICILALYYSNLKWTAYFPINSNRLFNNKGQVYDIKKVLNSSSGFDDGKYKKYGPPYFSAANLILYGAHFALYPFAIFYEFATEWATMSASFVNIAKTIKGAFSSDADTLNVTHDDPHCEMMAQYPEVPSWWFLTILIASVSCAILAVSVYPSETPMWGIFFAIGINFVFLVPLTTIASVTGFSFGLNVLIELIVGYAIPNSGLALITLKAYGYNIDSQASNYITDQKLGHYTKLPPRAIFRGQIISSFMSVFVALAVANWQIAHIPKFCDTDQPDRLECPGANTYFYSSIQFGEIGPRKVFTEIYPALKWCFLLGALMVIPAAFFKKKGPAKYTKYFHPTIMLGGFMNFAPFNLLYFTGGLYLSYLFMYHIKRTYAPWWNKYNYVLTGALSAGTTFSALLIFLTVQYHRVTFNWWGNRLDHMGIEGSPLPHSWKNATDAPGGYVGI